MMIVIHPEYDSDNTAHPHPVEVRGNENSVEFKLEWMERRISFKLEDLEKIVKFFKAE